MRCGPRGRVVLAHAFSAIGISLPWPLLLAGVWGLTHDDLLLGLTGAARMLPYVLFSWWAASLADRWDRRRVIMVSAWLRVGLLAGGWAAISAQAWGWAVACCASAVAAATPSYPALVASLPSLGPGSARRSTDLLVTVEVSSFVVGPAVGGLLLTPSLTGWAGPLAVLTAAAGAMVMGAVAVPASAGATEPRLRADRIGALLRRSGRVRGAIGAICVVNLVESVLVVALVPLAAAHWGGMTAYGRATAALGAGALLAPLLWWLGRSLLGRVHLGMVTVAVAMAVLSVADGLPYAVAPLAVVGAAAVHVEAAATGILQLSVPDRVRAGVLGVTDTAMVSAALLGSLAGPALEQALGPRPLLVVLAAGTVGSGLIALPVVRRRRGVDLTCGPGADVSPRVPSP